MKAPSVLFWIWREKFSNSWGLSAKQQEASYSSEYELLESHRWQYPAVAGAGAGAEVEQVEEGGRGEKKHQPVSSKTAHGAGWWRWVCWTGSLLSSPHSCINIFWEKLLLEKTNERELSAKAVYSCSYKLCKGNQKTGFTLRYSNFILLWQTAEKCDLRQTVKTTFWL